MQTFLRNLQHSFSGSKSRPSLKSLSKNHFPEINALQSLASGNSRVEGYAEVAEETAK
jgi:hypothetical protein